MRVSLWKIKTPSKTFFKSLVWILRDSILYAFPFPLFPGFSGWLSMANPKSEPITVHNEDPGSSVPVVKPDGSVVDPRVLFPCSLFISHQNALK